MRIPQYEGRLRRGRNHQPVPGGQDFLVSQWWGTLGAGMVQKILRLLDHCVYFLRWEVEICSHHLGRLWGMKDGAPLEVSFRRDRVGGIDDARSFLTQN